MVRGSVRSLFVVIGVISGVLAIGWSLTLASAVQLLAVTVLTMGGTQHPLIAPDGTYAEDPAFVDDYVDDAIRVYVVPSAAVRGDDPLAEYEGVAVHTPEEFGPVFGTMTFNDSLDAGLENLDACVQGSPCVARTVPGDPDTATPPQQFESPFVVYGYSQSAVIATMEKRRLIERARNGQPVPDVSFVLLANPNRPNGGVMQRFDGMHIPMLDVTFNGSTPTDGDFTTVDIARQYDGWADFPVYPMNMAATANALLGIYYLHGDYWSAGVGTPLKQGAEGDTTYYLIPSERLPLLMPLEQLGVPSPMLTAIDAPLRVIVELGYDRDPDHVGTPTRARLIPLVNPITGVTNLVVAIPTGLDDGAAEAAGDPEFRPFGTAPVTSPYGVGGEELGEPLAPPQPESARTTPSTEPTDPAPADTDEVAEKAADTPPVTPVDRPRTNILRNLVPPRGDSSSEAPAQRRPLKRLIDRFTGQREQTQEPAGGAADDAPESASESDPDAA
ncbi:PE-PPE domain-containing protein [Mycolicibacterium litorale]|uniref:PE-PPE domain-containing protein n=1 Tax=Mycolicibacterium litorale TaxID=758802 RepID=UPI00399F4758